MTYPHALQYLCYDWHQDNIKLANSDRIRQLWGCLPDDAVSTPPPFLIALPKTKQGHATALFLSSVLATANVCCAHLIEPTAAEPKPSFTQLRSHFLLDGQPIPPSALLPSCQSLAAAEQRMLRPQGEHLSGEERCTIVLTHCLSRLGCRVILWEGAPDSAAVSLLLCLLPHALGLTVVSDTDSAQLPLRFLCRGIREVVCTNCDSATYRTISDACVRAECRLSFVSIKECRRSVCRPASQVMDYRNIEGCRLSCGAPSATHAAMLATEVLLTLRRHGLAVNDDAIRQGLSQAVLPLYFAVCAIHPLLIADCIETPLDLPGCVENLRAMQQLTDGRCRLIVQPELQEALTPLLLQISLVDENTPEQDVFTLIVGSEPFLQQSLATFAPRMRRL